MTRAWIPIIVSLAGLIGCQSEEAPEETSGQQPPLAEPSLPGSTVATAPPAEAVLHVPVGKFVTGSRPGEPGRIPALEALPGTAELGPFRIDARPYPGKAGEAPRLGLLAEEAHALCATRGGRLCTELEWEHACRGAAGHLYPGGAKPCTKGECPSVYDVRQMTSLPEWTKSEFPSASVHKGESVVRGGTSKQPNERRCASRVNEGEVERSEIGFRCCYGAPNAAKYPQPSSGEPYEVVDLSLEEAKTLLAQEERTRPLLEDLALFRDRDVTTVFERGPGDTKGFTLTHKAVRWRPAPGMQLLVFAGKSGKRTAFVVAYYESDEERLLAGTFVMKNEKGPIVLAFAPSIRPRMHFSGCWGCAGETGKLLYRPPEEVVLLQP